MPSYQRRLGSWIATGGLAWIALLTLMPHPGAAARAASTPLTCILCGDAGGVDFFLNVVLFVPLGLGLRLAGFSWRRTVFLSALMTLGVELLQMKVVAGRDASLGDVVANTLGGGLGASVGVLWRRFATPDPARARRLALAYALGLGCVWLGTAWALGTALPRGARWFGAWAPELDNFDRFPGDPVLVSAGGEPLLPGGPAIDQARFQDAVTAQPSIAFRAVLSEQPRGLAPIGMVVDEWHRDVILIGQDRQDLAFRVSMRASLLKLNSPTAYLRNGMAGEPGDTVDAAGALRDGSFELRSRIKGREISRSLPLSASWGWTLITPWNSVLGEEVRFLTALWITGLIAVLAFWSALAGGASLVIPPITIALLLGAIPRAAGFPPAHSSEWLAALVGVLLGMLASRPALKARSRSADPEHDEGAVHA